MSPKNIGSGVLIHVPQRTGNDCAIAVAAIVANVPYQTAAEQSSVRPGSRGLCPLELIRVLETLSGVPWRTNELRWTRPLFRFADSSHPLVLLVRKPWSRKIRHYVATWGGKVFDPNMLDGCPHEDYDRRRWRVLQVLRPLDPARLEVARRDRHWHRCMMLD